MRNRTIFEGTAVFLWVALAFTPVALLFLFSDEDPPPCTKASFASTEQWHVKGRVCIVMGLEDGAAIECWPAAEVEHVPQADGGPQ